MYREGGVGRLAILRHAPVVQNNKPWTTSSTTAPNTDLRTDWKEYDRWASRQYPGYARYEGTNDLFCFVAHINHQ